MKSKVMGAEQALSMIKDGDTIAISSAGMVGYPDYLSKVLEDMYLRYSHPADLTLFAGCGHGIPNRYGGDERFGHPGFLKRFVGSHPDVVPHMRKFIEDNEIEGYVLPQGILNQLYRCSAAKQPGLLSKIGIGTYIDPRQDGGKLNAKTTEDIVKLAEIDGEEYLFYKSSPINVAMFRATTADENGNISIEEEAQKLEILEMAMAAKASKGVVIAQVKRVVANGHINANNVAVPGDHSQTAGTVYSPYFSGELIKPSSIGAKAKAKLAPEDIICRRAVMELYPGAVVNIGKGVGAGVGPAASVEGIDQNITFTLELGSVGGTPMPKLDFAAAMNPTSFLAHPTMFDFYHGGGLDITFLGAAELDKDGNVNVSKYAGRAAGQGGFIYIRQSAKKVVFCTYFTAKGFKGDVEDGKLVIVNDGAVPKFVNTVEQITFNGKLAAEKKQDVVICTERAVFKLVENGLMVTEIAPGVDLEKDIFAHMGFKPLVSDDLKIMDERIFVPGRMGCFD